MARKRRGGYRRGHRPYNKGKSCRSFKYVKMRGRSKKVRRCRTYKR
jgi:hypothetical protein